MNPFTLIKIKFYLFKGPALLRSACMLPLILALITRSFAGTLPKPDHIVVVIFENHSYSNIIGSSSAPYINYLISDSHTALFTNAYGVFNGSQPNYLILFSGSNQGITSSAAPSDTPLTTCNLGGALIEKGLSFTGYAEYLPSVGYEGVNSGYYDRKHNPWCNWQGTLTNDIPATDNQPFSSLPLDYDSLPDLAFVVPNEMDNMHTGTIQQGDAWLQANLDPYIQWANTHNSLLIFTFDEDDGTNGEHIPTLFIGQMVKGGSYSTFINHYSVNRTLQDIYGLSLCTDSAQYTDITSVWNGITMGIYKNPVLTNYVTVYPVPARRQLDIYINSVIYDNAVISVCDVTGRQVREEKISLVSGQNAHILNLDGVEKGSYFVSCSGNEIQFCKKIVVE